LVLSAWIRVPGLPHERRSCSPDASVFLAAYTRGVCFAPLMAGNSGRQRRMVTDLAAAAILLHPLRATLRHFFGALGEEPIAQAVPLLVVAHDFTACCAWRCPLPRWRDFPVRAARDKGRGSIYFWGNLGSLCSVLFGLVLIPFRLTSSLLLGSQSRMSSCSAVRFQNPRRAVGGVSLR